MRAWAIAFVLVAACSASADPKVYEVSAYEGPGPEPILGEIIIADARRRIPDAIRSCEITRIQTLDASDGVVLFGFDASKQQLGCVMNVLPDDAELRSLQDGRVLKARGKSRE